MIWIGGIGMKNEYVCDDCQGLGTIRIFAGNVDGGKSADDTTITCPECKGKGGFSILLVQDVMKKILPLQGKHLFTEHLGDAEIERLTLKSNPSGVWVYFHSNLHGCIRYDGKELLEEIMDVKEIK